MADDDIIVQLSDGRTVAFPKGMTPQRMQFELQRAGLGAPERSTGEKVGRGAGLFMQNVNDSVAHLLGLPGDILASVAPSIGDPRASFGRGAKIYDERTGALAPVGETEPRRPMSMGLPTSRDIKRGFDYVATLPRRIGDAVSGGTTDPLTAPDEPNPTQEGPYYTSRGAPETTTEKIIAGSGRAVGDVASSMGVGKLLQMAAPANSTASNVGGVLQVAPGTQLAASTAGNVTSELTGSPWAGLAAGIGAAAGLPLMQAGLRRAIQPVQSQLDAEGKRLAGVMEGEGITLTPGQKTGSTALKTAESVLGNIPGSSGAQQAVYQKQRDAFTAAVLKRMGVTGTKATPDVLDAARTRIGAEFDRLSNATTVRLDPKFDQDIAKVTQQYARLLPAMQREIVERYVDDLVQFAGVMPGANYQATRSMLYSQAKSARGSDAFFANALDGVRKALDDAADRAITPANRDAWNTARREWANMKIIEKAMSGAGAEAATGNVPPLALRGAVNASTPQGYARGHGELRDLAAGGQAFLRPPPDSGTAQRTMWTNALTGGGALGLGAVAGADLATLGAGTGLAVGLPYAAQKFINSPAGRAWLTNQMGQTWIPPFDPWGVLVPAAQSARQLQER